jgi:hypothetical protein
MTFGNRLLQDKPRVPFSLLGPDMANVPPERTLVVDHLPDTTGMWEAGQDNDGRWLRNEAGQLTNRDGKTADEAIPAGALRSVRRSIHKGAISDGTRWGSPTPDDRTSEASTIGWHRIGTVVLRNADEGFGQDYLCSMDESSYFCSRLPHQVGAVSEAFEALKPVEVRDWEARTGLRPERQGEWFFIRIITEANLLIPIQQIQTPYDLPRTSKDSNLHRCQEGYTGALYETWKPEPQPIDDGLHARGTVVHLMPDGSGPSREHADLELGSSWHSTHKNTSLADWTIPNNSSRGPMVD